MLELFILDCDYAICFYLESTISPFYADLSFVANTQMHRIKWNNMLRVKNNWLIHQQQQ